MARDAFGELIDLCDADKDTLRKSMKKSQNVSLSECLIAANENGIEADTRQLLKLRNEILQERMSEMMRTARAAGKGGEE